jgi:predicted nucleic acid-binding protein
MLDVSALVARHQGRKVYLDTNLFIYVLNGTPGLVVPCVELLDACSRGDLIGLTGDLTLAELQVQPLRLNDAAALAAVRELLVDSGAVTLVGHDRACFEKAALLRARHGLKMPDALHLATAQLAGAACCVSNDQQFPSLADIEFVSLAG